MHFFHTHVSRRAEELVAEVLHSTFISEGKKVQLFEEALERDLGMTRPVTVNSGTSALHLALVLAQAGPGDEVILPPQTFVATALAVLMCGAKPVFADIQPETGNLCPLDFGKRITPRTKAVIPVHWAGLPCDMDEIHAVAARHDVAVIEDAAHALGAVYRGRPVGSLSRFTAFSFQAIKHLTTGDGGAVCCLNMDDYEMARRLRWFGIDRWRDKPSLLGERQYNLQGVGFKYHLNDIGGAMGFGNLPDMPANLARHRFIDATYFSGLQNVPGLRHLRRLEDRVSSCWFFSVLVERREDFVRALAARGVPASVVHQRIDKNDAFGGMCRDLPGQEAYDAEQIALPVHVGLTDEDVSTVIDTVRAGW